MRLAVMRPADKLADSIAQATEAGFEVVAASPLRVEVRDDERFVRFLTALDDGKVDTIVLTSTTGVDALRQLMSRRGRSEMVKDLGSCERVAIGPLTARAMEDAEIGADMMPQEHTSEGLVRELGDRLSGKKVWVLRSSHGEPVLVDGLRAAGCSIEEVVVYDLVPQPNSPEMRSLAQQCVAGTIDAYAFTSSLSAATFIEAAERFADRGSVIKMLNSRLVAAMGGPTRRKLEQMGIRVGLVPRQATFAAILAELKSEAQRPR